MVKKIFLGLILLISFCFITIHVHAEETTTEYDQIYFTANSDTIYKSATGILTLNDVKDLVITYLVYDESLPLCIELLKDTYTGNGEEPGTYEVYYNCRYDVPNNVNSYSSMVVKLNVIVPSGAQFNADYYFNGWIYTRQVLDKKDVLTTLRICDVIENVYNYSTFTSDYFDLSDDEKLDLGVYYGSYSYVSTTGYSGEGVFRIKILEQIQTDVVYEVPVNYRLIIGIIIAVITVAAGVVIAILMKRKLDYKKQ